MNVRLVQFVALIMAVLALVPSAAHLFELPGKTDLTVTDYYVVQSIYSGWALFGAVWIAALIASAVLAVLVRRQRWPLRLATMSSLCFVLMFAIFFIWTSPANQATANWTSIPANWEVLRAQWEYSHAVNSVIVFAAVCCVYLSAVTWRPSGG
ncbi:DUF1772 domain-containing protein [Hoeflea sp. YIM 152468]|uniref:DUF1772 domain-containing protein n=1 Tax=Hoeflea sp. YIM 152468 TaxID=3031759 RepID=UPI0023DAF175|nr:DUF1772 domain-containing protein [Hoeflea sp. YIM 152468]MDF1609644.1 DUF1772 domain-containing protein [Hoeflea sp. YIM 152468]